MMKIIDILEREKRQTLTTIPKQQKFQQVSKLYFAIDNIIVEFGSQVSNRQSTYR